MTALSGVAGLRLYPDSVCEVDGVTYGMAASDAGAKFLCIAGSVEGFTGGREVSAGIRMFPLNAENASLLRRRLDWLAPRSLGLQTSAGFGDRLGLATPGHVRALRQADPRGSIVPIFAQQSVRENARTHRTPQQVMDDAAWGVFEAGWRRPWGADADHLKTTADLDSFFEAGYTFFTIDPGEHVDNAAQSDSISVLAEKARALPWDRLTSSPEETVRRFVGKSFDISEFYLELDEAAVLRALAKYGRSVAHTAALADHLAQRAGGAAVDLEVSVDETEAPTTVEEHFFVASELKRLGVHATSLAPRFIGRFEKGVDYIGDLEAFDAEFARHAAVARYFNYRLSLHSGSDKFSIYTIAARRTGGLVHLKTAGTSYLEALRVTAQANPGLFREIFQMAVERYEQDRASYHVSAELGSVPAPSRTADEELPSLLNLFDARQVFHVTFGAALERFGPQLMDELRGNELAYYEALARHFERHLEPFVRAG